jgi:signal peptidase II
VRGLQAAGGAALSAEAAPGRVGGEPVPAARRRLPAVLTATAVAVLAADQASKAWAVQALTGRGRVPLLGEVFGLELVRNPGAAFSFATGSTWVFTVVAAVAAVVIVRVARRLGSGVWAVALGLLLGGALGNLVDRLARAPGPGRGHVVDFLAFPHFPIFNVADSCITVAAALIALQAFRGVGVDGRREDR